ncbi:hypothetical protein HOY80DRAFT_855355, partial [Tuber brumale]
VKNTRIIITNLLENVIQVELVGTKTGGTSKKNKFYLAKIIFEFQSRFCSWIIQGKQFPLNLVYATIFNSHQGLILERAIIDLQVPPFAHAYLYTSISRVQYRDH